MKNKLRKHKKFVSAGVVTAVIILAFLLIQMRLDFRWGSQARASHLEDVLPDDQMTPGQSPAGQPDTKEESPALPDSSFHNAFQAQALKIAQVTDSPEKIEADLNQMARALTSQQVQALRMTANKDHNGDEAALALDLLGRSDDPAAQKALVDFVLNGPTSSMREQSTFQLFALEGIIDQTSRSGQKEALTKIMHQSHDPLTQHRAGQALAASQGQAQWPAETDQQGLSELLAKSSQNN